MKTGKNRAEKTEILKILLLCYNRNQLSEEYVYARTN